MEHWKAIPGYEGLYEASTLGRIRSAEGKTTSSARFKKRVWKQRIMAQKINGNKRKDARVDLWKGSEHKTWLVSRLIALTFCPGYEPGLTVNHINGNHIDNRVENLEWVTTEENNRKAFETGLCDSFCKKVTLTNLQTGESTQYRSLAYASKALGKSTGYLSNRIKRGCTYPAPGFLVEMEAG